MKEKERTAKDGNDEELVSLCQKGGLDAFEVLVRRHQKRMFNIAYRMLGDQEEATNTVQDAFLSAYRGIKNFKGEAQFSTWLYSIIINHSRNRLKQLQTQRHHESFSLDEPILTGNEVFIKIETDAGIVGYGEATNNSSALWLAARASSWSLRAVTSVWMQM